MATDTIHDCAAGPLPHTYQGFEWRESQPGTLQRLPSWTGGHEEMEDLALPVLGFSHMATELRHDKEIPCPDPASWARATSSRPFFHANMMSEFEDSEVLDAPRDDEGAYSPGEDAAVKGVAEELAWAASTSTATLTLPATGAVPPAKAPLPLAPAPYTLESSSLAFLATLGGAAAGAGVGVGAGTGAGLGGLADPTQSLHLWLAVGSDAPQCPPHAATTAGPHCHHQCGSQALCGSPRRETGGPGWEPADGLEGCRPTKLLCVGPGASEGEGQQPALSHTATTPEAQAVADQHCPASGHPILGAWVVAACMTGGGVPAVLTCDGPALGEGGCGTVYPAGPSFVLKVLRPGQWSGTPARPLAHPATDAHSHAHSAPWEMVVLQALPAHPSIICAPQVAHRKGPGGTTRALVYPRYAGDLVDVFNLSIMRGSSAAEAARSVAWQMLSVLGHIHSAGWAHCDIKLDNIFGDGEGLYVLGDWGSAKRLVGARAPDELYVGTLSYKAPELCSGHGNWAACDLRACDVYALGGTLLALAVMETPSVQWRDHLMRATRLPASPLRDLVCAMLTVDPATRPTASALLAHPYFQGASFTTAPHVTVHAAPSGPHPR